MDICNKIAIFAAVIIIIISSFSGCILNEIFGTSFTLNSYEIIDDEGFAGLSLDFLTTGEGTSKLYGPGNNLIDSDFFYIGNQNSVIYLADYRSTVKSGIYKLKSYDKNGDEINEESISLSGSDLSINSLDAKWWKSEVWKDSLSLVGLNLSVFNSGDSPVYPDKIDVNIESETFSVSVLPVAVMSGVNTFIDCFVYKEDVVDNAISVLLKDINGVTIASGSFTPLMTHNVATREFKWNHDGKSYYLNIPDTKYLIEYFSNLDRIYHEDYAVYVYDSYDDDYLDMLVDNLMDGFGMDSDVDKVNFAASFVQNLDYKLDSDTNTSVEYARYPVETLFNGDGGGGDCEDLSILMASILDKIDIDVALLRLPNHMAVGVKLDEDVLPQYDYYTENYYFLETTSVAPSCGYIPSSSKSPSELTVYPISSRPWLKHSWRNGTLTIFYMGGTADYVKAIIIVENLGAIPANNILVKGGFYTNYGQELNAEFATISKLKPGMKTKINLMNKVPHNTTTTFKTKIYYKNEVVDEHESESTFG